MFLNARSIFNKVEMLELLLYNFKPEVVCLGETWLNKEKNKYFKIENYSQITDDYRVNKNGGGVAIFSVINSTIKVILISIINALSVEDIFECCGAIITCSKFNLVLINIHRPSNKANTFNFIELLEDIFSAVKNNYCDLPIVVSGDLNSDNLEDRWKRNVFMMYYTQIIFMPLSKNILELWKSKRQSSRLHYYGYAKPTLFCKCIATSSFRPQRA